MNTSIIQGKKKNILLLFGSRATNTYKKDSDYDFLYIYDRNEQDLDIIRLLKKHNGRVSIDKIRFDEYINCLRIGCPDIILINTQAVVLQGHEIMEKIQYQNQGITSLTVSLCIGKADKLLRNAREYLEDRFLREAAHRLSMAAFWIGAAECFLHGTIPSDKKYIFQTLQSQFDIPLALSEKFSSYDVADLEEPPKNEVLRYLRKVSILLRRFYQMAFEEYLNKAKRYLSKAQSHFLADDPDSAIMMAHSSIELAIKGYLIKKIKKAPLYLLEALSNTKFLLALEEIFDKQLLKDIVELNKIRNSVYHTVYSPTKQDAKFALKIATDVITKITDIK
ncbi:MAG: HEPN domain-containing protein [Candidatus Asgardarchaeia archaeon]